MMIDLKRYSFSYSKPYLTAEMLYFILMNECYLNQYQDQSWVIGVSGGPDSMALLDLAFNSKISLFVVHVNYHKRDSAQRDQAIVEAYCNEKGIKCNTFNAPKFEVGNFQENARNFRYQKMIDVFNETDADAIVVAHHADDDLETYLFQKDRQSNVDTFGLKKESTFKSVRLLRPLLEISKIELISYCEEHQIPYGLDESNEDITYSRNRIRKDIESMSKSEKDLLFIEKESRNLSRQKYIEENKFLLNKTDCSLETFNNLSDKQQFILEWLKWHSVNKAISNDFIIELIRQIDEGDSFVMPVGDLRFVKQYGNLSLLKNIIQKYEYLIEKEEDREYNEFSISFTKNSKNHIKFSDFPLTIKSCQGNEKVGSINLNRWFIKYKIPLAKRELWPVIYNTNGKLIYVANRSFIQGANANKITLTVVK